MPRTSAPNREILEAALQGLESQREKLDEQIAQVRGLLGSRVGRPPKTAKNGGSSGQGAQAQKSGRKRRQLSAEARKRIAAAQKKRWAAFRKSQG
jgi:hypothetical protein